MRQVDDADLLSWSASESESESEDSLIDKGYDETRVEDEDWEIAERGE
jgi:RIO kinase 1